MSFSGKGINPLGTLKRKKIFVNFIMVLVSIFLTFFICEKVFQKLIFSKSKGFQKLRNPGDYAESWDSDHWKLFFLWGNRPAIKVNKTFGWCYRFYPNTFIHPQTPEMVYSKKRPVLIYGDSFAACVDSSKGFCFEDYMNNDTSFNQTNFLFNYGIGAWGVDQIYTAIRLTAKRYENPLVIFTLMIDDLDRSLLDFREGEKPVYKIKDDEALVFDDSKLRQTQKRYIKENPPRIKFYLGRRLLYSKLNFLPQSATDFLSGKTKAIEESRKLNERIIFETINFLRENNIDFMILVFCNKENMGYDENSNWKYAFLRNRFKEKNVDFIWTKNLIADSVRKDMNKVNDYFYVADLHPTPLFNRIISDELIKRVISGNYERNSDRRGNKKINTEELYSWKLDSIIKQIKRNKIGNSSGQELIKQQEESEETLQKKAMEIYVQKFEQQNDLE